MYHYIIRAQYQIGLQSQVLHLNEEALNKLNKNINFRLSKVISSYLSNFLFSPIQMVYPHLISSEGVICVAHLNPTKCKSF